MLSRQRLAVVATHPVQYNAPWFRLLNERDDISLRAFYTWHAGDAAVRDPGFGKAFQWDIPLLDGYEWELVPPSRPVQRRTFRNMDSPAIVERVSAWQPDAVLVFGWNFRSHLRVMRHFHGRIPVLFRGDSTLLDVRPGIRSLLRSLLLRYVYSHVDFALPVGYHNRQYFLNYGLSVGQLVTVPHAIDNQRFAGTDGQYDREAELLRKELGFADDDVVILFAGKFEPIKNPLGLLRTFQAAARRRQNLRLLLVGNGALENEVNRIVAADSHIRTLPFQNQKRMPVVYRTGDIICLPSRNETWGLCLNEAMACGRPIMATAHVGAAYDLLREGQTGFLCPELGSTDAVERFVRLPDREVLLDTLGRGCKLCIQDWSFDRIVTSLAQLLLDLDARRRQNTDRDPS